MFIPRSIKVYRTHIEITPYMKGDEPLIEKMYSRWDKIYHSYVQVGYYINNNKLYLPRGTNLIQLNKIFKASPILVSNSDNAYHLIKPIEMVCEPKNKTQEEAIDFLTFQNNFTKGLQYSQFGLNLDTGAGKTFCMISAISKLNYKAIIITHKTRIKEQWVNQFLNKTDIEDDRIMDINGSADMERIINEEVEADIYIINHQTITSYARKNGWDVVRDFFKKTHVGIKVIDESHKFFQNTLMIDFFSDVKLNYYLTATFTRNDPMEIRMYKRAFSSLYRYGEETLDYKDNRKHIVLCTVIYKSCPDYNAQKEIISNSYGFNSFKYIDYALKGDSNNTMIKVIRMIMDKIENLEGRVLIISPKIESVEYVAKIVSRITEKSVGFIHSNRTDEENQEVIKNCDVIVSTISGIGEGDDIPGLRVLINTEPIGSKGLVDQLRGRLREYSETEDTYMFYLIDSSIDYTYKMFKRIKPVFEKKCKEILIMPLTNIP